MVIYDSCFWCLSLRTGCILIITFEIIFQILGNVAFRPLDLPLLAVISGNLLVGAFTGLLIYGIIEHKRSWLWLWIAINMIIVILFAILSVWTAVDYIFPTDLDPIGRGHTRLYSIIISVISAIFAITRIVFALIIYSYICKLHEQQNSVYSEVNN